MNRGERVVIRWDLLLALLAGLAVVGASIAFGLKVSKDSLRTRYLLSIQIRRVFEDLAPRIGARLVGAEPLDHERAQGVASFPVLRGNYRGHNVRMWFSVQDPESGAGMGIGIAVLASDGLRWPKHRHLRAETRIEGLSAEARQLIGRIADPRRKPCRVNDLELSASELSSVAEHVGPEQMDVEGTTMRKYADAAELHQILDELTTLANLLPVAVGPKP